jgi:hypothetical protein
MPSGGAAADPAKEKDKEQTEARDCTQPDGEKHREDTAPIKGLRWKHLEHCSGRQNAYSDDEPPTEVVIRGARVDAGGANGEESEHGCGCQKGDCQESPRG